MKKQFLLLAILIQSWTSANSLAAQDLNWKLELTDRGQNKVCYFNEMLPVSTRNGAKPPKEFFENKEQYELVVRETANMKFFLGITPKGIPASEFKYLKYVGSKPTNEHTFNYVYEDGKVIEKENFYPEFYYCKPGYQSDFHDHCFLIRKASIACVKPDSPEISKITFMIPEGDPWKPLAAPDVTYLGKVSKSEYDEILTLQEQAVAKHLENSKVAEEQARQREAVAAEQRAVLIEHQKALAEQAQADKLKKFMASERRKSNVLTTSQKNSILICESIYSITHGNPFSSAPYKCDLTDDSHLMVNEVLNAGWVIQNQSKSSVATGYTNSIVFIKK